MKHVGVFLGSFNPITIGHLMVAQSALEVVDEVWFVVSPHNPAKWKKGILEDASERFVMTQFAVEDNPRLKASDIEFDMPVPSYTHRTLERLREKYPDHKMSILCGTDTQHKISIWRSSTEIIKHHDLIVYPRQHNSKNQIKDEVLEKSTILTNVPTMEVSSTMIRDRIQQNKPIKYMVPDKVINYIERNNLFKNLKQKNGSSREKQDA